MLLFKIRYLRYVTKLNNLNSTSTKRTVYQSLFWGKYGQFFLEFLKSIFMDTKNILWTQLFQKIVVSIQEKLVCFKIYIIFSSGNYDRIDDGLSWLFFVDCDLRTLLSIFRSIERASLVLNHFKLFREKNKNLAFFGSPFLRVR